MLLRSQNNPVITREMIPAISPHLVDVSSVFNPGAVKIDDTIHLLLRVQNRGRETFTMHSTSKDGINFTIEHKSALFSNLDQCSDTIYHIYDPRITMLDSTIYIIFAIDTDKGCRLGLFTADDFSVLDFHGFISDNDSRNGVLFPEKIRDQYVLLERPNNASLENGPTSGDSIILSSSLDLVHWIQQKVLCSGRPHYWDERIGSGPPPVKTRDGWLHIYHGIATHFASSNIYQAGVMLLDLDDPSIVKARSRYNILEPRELYELTGQVPNVVFPSGMIVMDVDSDGFASPDSDVYVYYGAADTTVGLATTTINELVQDCYADRYYDHQ